MNEIASLNRKSGPPFRPTNRCPRSVNSTVMTDPFSPPGVSLADRLTASTLLSGKIDVQNSAASSAWPSNQRHGVIGDMFGPPKWMRRASPLDVPVMTVPPPQTHRSAGDGLGRRMVEHPGRAPDNEAIRRECGGAHVVERRSTRSGTGLR